MAAKRFSYDSSTNAPDQPNGKRMMRSRRSFASVIGEVVMVNCLENFCSALEPMLRRVVNEEVENSLRRRGHGASTRTITRSPSLRIQALEAPPSFQLKFRNKLSPSIFTGSKILDIENSPLQILLVDTTCHQLVQQSCLPSPVKVEIVVLDGDFPSGDMWTSEQFEKKIQKERTGKRPLLTGGDLQVTMRDGFAAFGGIEFTDNSSWIRSRKFRLGARVVQGSGQGVLVREAMTESFVVKDHRGESYRKHHPPMLHDEIWRLQKIGKDGVFHKKLDSEGIKTVQDFLKLSVIEPYKLRKILCNGMSEKMWDITLKHARTCVMDNKLHIYRGSNYTVILNPICQVVKAVINGQTYSNRDITTATNKVYLENLVREAYLNWNSLEEVLNETPLLSEGNEVEQYPNHNPHQSMALRSNHQQALLIDSSTGVASVPSIITRSKYNDW